MSDNKDTFTNDESFEEKTKLVGKFNQDDKKDMNSVIKPAAAQSGGNLKTPIQNTSTLSVDKILSLVLLVAAVIELFAARFLPVFIYNDEPFTYFSSDMLRLTGGKNDGWVWICFSLLIGVYALVSFLAKLKSKVLTIIGQIILFLAGIAGVSDLFIFLNGVAEHSSASVGSGLWTICLCSFAYLAVFVFNIYMSIKKKQAVMQ